MTSTERVQPQTAEQETVADAPKRRPRISARWASVLFGVALLALWDLAVRSGLVHEIIMPYPLDVVTATGELVSGAGQFWFHTWITTLETLVGFAVGALIGFALGALVGTWVFLRQMWFPYIVAFQGLPKVVLAPVFLTAFGFGITSKIAMAVVLAFFPVLINTMVGLASVEPEQVKLMRSYAATRGQTFRMLTLPTAVPFIFAGLKTSLTFALIGAIVGEFVGAAEGLGFLLHLYAYQLRVPEVWAIMVALALLGVILYGTIEWVDRKIVFWRRHDDLSAGL